MTKTSSATYISISGRVMSAFDASRTGNIAHHIQPSSPVCSPPRSHTCRRGLMLSVRIV